MATSSMSTAESQPASEGAAIVVMGVSGAEQTTVGRPLAKALDGVFVDGDDPEAEPDEFRLWAEANLRRAIPRRAAALGGRSQ